MGAARIRGGGGNKDPPIPTDGEKNETHFALLTFWGTSLFGFAALAGGDADVAGAVPEPENACAAAATLPNPTPVDGGCALTFRSSLLPPAP